MPDDRNRRRRCHAALGLGVLALLTPGLAQAQLRSLIVPADAGVAVAARGQAQPRLVAPPAALQLPADEGPAPLQLPAGGQGLAAPLGLVLPLAAGALLGAGLSQGGGSGGGSPVRTR